MVIAGAIYALLGREMIGSPSGRKDPKRTSNMDDTAKFLTFAGIAFALLAIAFTSGPHCLEAGEIGEAISGHFIKNRSLGRSLGCSVAEHMWTKQEREQAARRAALNDAQASR